MSYILSVGSLVGYIGGAMGGPPICHDFTMAEKRGWGMVERVRGYVCVYGVLSSNHTSDQVTTLVEFSSVATNPS